MGNLPEITTSLTRNPPEEEDSVGNYQIIDEKSTRGREFHRELPAYQNSVKILRTVTISGAAAPNPTVYTCNTNFFLI
jgi:hypothetical protein